MNKILVVITKMRTEKGGSNDEFTQLWARGEDRDRGHIHFRRQSGDDTSVVLVIHGYDYPTRMGEQAVEQAAGSITPALAEVNLHPAEVGVAFHPPSAWVDEATSDFARGLASKLKAAGRTVKFVTEYRNGSPIQFELAPSCAGGQDFSRVFEKCWAILSANINYDASMGRINHKIEGKLFSLVADLDDWKALDLCDERGRELLVAYEGKAACVLQDVRNSVTQPDLFGDTVAGLVDHRLIGMADEEAKTITEAFTRLRKLLDESSDAGYDKSKKIVDLLNGVPPDQKPQSDGENNTLNELRSLLKDHNPVAAWRTAVLSAFKDLRGAINSARAER